MLARVRSTFEERSETEDFATRLLAWAGAYAILFVGGAHILICGEHFLVASYLGLAFVANFLGSLVVAASLFLGGRTWAWLLGRPGGRRCSSRVYGEPHDRAARRPGVRGAVVQHRGASCFRV